MQMSPEVQRSKGTNSWTQTQCECHKKYRAPIDVSTKQTTQVTGSTEKQRHKFLDTDTMRVSQEVQSADRNFHEIDNASVTGSTEKQRHKFMDTDTMRVSQEVQSAARATFPRNRQRKCVRKHREAETQVPGHRHNASVTRSTERRAIDVSTKQTMQVCPEAQRSKETGSCMDTDNASVTIRPQYEMNFKTVAQFATHQCGDTKHRLIHSSLTNCSQTLQSRGPQTATDKRQGCSSHFSAEDQTRMRVCNRQCRCVSVQKTEMWLTSVHPMDPHRKLSDTFCFSARGTTRDRCDTPNSRAEHIQKVIDRSHTSLQCGWPKTDRATDMRHILLQCRGPRPDRVTNIGQTSLECKRTQTRQSDKYRTDLAWMQEDPDQPDRATDTRQTLLQYRWPRPYRVTNTGQTSFQCNRPQTRQTKRQI